MPFSTEPMHAFTCINSIYMRCHGEHVQPSCVDLLISFAVQACVDSMLPALVSSTV